MELSPGWVGAGLTAASVVGGALVNYLNGQISGVKATQKIIFEKLDRQNSDLQDYKLHVAETYVSESTLEKALKPVVDSLAEIQKELREERRK